MSVQALAHSVQYKLSWADDWIDAPFLYAERVTFALAPALPHAELFYRAGPLIQRMGETEFLSYERLSLQGYYIKISIDQPNGASPIVWFGIVMDRHEMLGGRHDVEHRYSQQTFVAYGLEYLLEKTRIDSSIFRKPDGREFRSNRAIGFNLGGGNEHDHKRVFNASANVGTKGAFTFTESLWLGNFWTGDRIIKYLQTYMMPTDFNGDKIIPWTYEPDDKMVDYVVPPMQVHGRTIREVLNMLMDRRRGLSWYAKVTTNIVTNADSIEIKPVSFSTTDITLPSGDRVMKANPLRDSWNFDADLLVREPHFVSTQSNKYNNVRVQGERMGVVFTTAYNSAHVKNWTTDLATAYNAGASGEGFYAAKEWNEKKEFNRIARQQVELESVYRFFVVPDSWDGKIDGVPILPEPLMFDLGGPTFFYEWVPGLRFQHHLPFREGVDYSGTAIRDGTEESILPNIKRGDFTKPIGWIKVGEDDDENALYERIDRLGQGMKDGIILPQTIGRSFTMSLKMENDSLGFQIDVHGAMQHSIAHDDFTPADMNGPDANDELGIPDLDYKDIIVTVYMLVDHFVTATWPDPEAVNFDDVDSTLLIQVKDYYLDYVLAGTVIDHDAAGHLVTVTASGYVRDDRDLLRDMARVAYIWFSVERKSLDVTIHSLDGQHCAPPQIGVIPSIPFIIGNMITTIGNDEVDGELVGFEEINSVITEISLDTRAQTTTIKTQFAELDVANVIGRGDR